MKKYIKSLLALVTAALLGSSAWAAPKATHEETIEIGETSQEYSFYYKETHEDRWWKLVSDPTSNDGSSTAIFNDAMEGKSYRSANHGKENAVFRFKGVKTGQITWRIYWTSPYADDPTVVPDDDPSNPTAKAGYPSGTDSWQSKNDSYETYTITVIESTKTKHDGAAQTVKVGADVSLPDDIGTAWTAASQGTAVATVTESGDAGVQPVVSGIARGETEVWVENTTDRWVYPVKVWDDVIGSDSVMLKPGASSSSVTCTSDLAAPWGAFSANEGVATVSGVSGSSTSMTPTIRGVSVGTTTVTVTNEYAKWTIEVEVSEMSKAEWIDSLVTYSKHSADTITYVDDNTAVLYTFNAVNGNQSITIPAGYGATADFLVVGGGGGGGGASRTGTTNRKYYYGKGGDGGEVKDWPDQKLLGNNTFTISVGAGGNYGQGANNGTEGTKSYVSGGSLKSALEANGGNGGSANANQTAPQSGEGAGDGTGVAGKTSQVTGGTYGAGGLGSDGADPSAATANTGNGGGGAQKSTSDNYNRAGANGGSGIVVIKITSLKELETPTVSEAPHANLAYGDRLSSADWSFAFTNKYGAPIEGDLKLVSADTVPTVVESGAAKWELTFTPDEPDVYKSATVLGAVTVQPAMLTATAKSYTIKTGSPAPEYEVEKYEGFVNGENESVITTTPTFSCHYAGAKGEYPITMSGAVAANYIFDYVPGTLSVRDTLPAQEFKKILEDNNAIVGATTVDDTTNPDALIISYTTTGTKTLKIPEGYGATARVLVIGGGARGSNGSYNQGGQGGYGGKGEDRDNVPLTAATYDIVVGKGQTSTQASGAATASSFGGGSMETITGAAAGNSAGFNNTSDITGETVTYGARGNTGASGVTPAAGDPGTGNGGQGGYGNNGAGGNGGSGIVVIKITSLKELEDVDLETLPTAAAITYGQALANATLTGGSVTNAAGTAVGGSFAWVNTTTKPAVADSDKTEYELVFTPTEGNVYKRLTGYTMTVTVNKAAVTVTAADKSMTDGGTIPTFTATYNPNITPATVPQYSCIYSAGDAPGAYDITPYGAEDPNCTFTYVKGTLTVSAKSAIDLITASVPGTTSGTSVIYKFTSGTGTLTVPKNYKATADILVVGGGGGGGGTYNSGSTHQLGNGGNGGKVNHENTAYSLVANTLSISVGTGGDAGGSGKSGGNGYPSSVKLGATTVASADGGTGGDSKKSSASAGSPTSGTKIDNVTYGKGGAAGKGGTKVTSSWVASAGDPNTGTGGQGGGNYYKNNSYNAVSAAAGGSGVVIIKITKIEALPQPTLSNPTAGTLTYGQALSTISPIGATMNGVSGTFTWACDTTYEPTVAESGKQMFKATFTHSNASYWSPVNVLLAVTVNKATPTVSAWPTVEGPVYQGMKLADITLKGGTANTDGTFAWTDGSIVADQFGPHAFGVTFAPEDTDNYNTATGSITLNVEKKPIPLNAKSSSAVNEAAVSIVDKGEVCPVVNAGGDIYTFDAGVDSGFEKIVVTNASGFAVADGYLLTSDEISRFTLNGIEGAAFADAFLPAGATFTDGAFAISEDGTEVTIEGGTFAYAEDFTGAFEGTIALNGDLTISVANGKTVKFPSTVTFSGSGKLILAGEGKLDFDGEVSNVVAEGYTGEIDGEEHAPVVTFDFTSAPTAPARTAKVQYRKSGEGAWSDEAPSFSEVCNTTVSYQILVEGVVKKSGSYAVKITQKTPETDPIGILMGESRQVICEGFGAEETWSVTVSGSAVTVDPMEFTGKVFLPMITAGNTKGTATVTIQSANVKYVYTVNVGAAYDENKVNLAYGGEGFGDEVTMYYWYRDQNDNTKFQPRHYQATYGKSSYEANTAEEMAACNAFLDIDLKSTAAYACIGTKMAAKASEGSAAIAVWRSSNDAYGALGGQPQQNGDYSVVMKPKRVVYVGKTVEAYCLSSCTTTKSPGTTSFSYAWSTRGVDTDVATVALSTTDASTSVKPTFTGVGVGRTSAIVENVQVFTDRTLSGSWPSDVTDGAEIADCTNGASYKLWVEVRDIPALQGALEVGSIVYGQTLAESAITPGTMKDTNGNDVDGTFEWADSTTAPKVSDSEKTPYYVIFTPVSEFYDKVLLPVTVKVYAPLTVTANDKEITRGHDLSEVTFDVEYDGFIDGDDENDLDGDLAFTCAYDKQTALAGETYAITPTGLTSDKYAITFVDGTLTVVAPVLTEKILTDVNASSGVNEKNLNDEEFLPVVVLENAPYHFDTDATNVAVEVRGASAFATQDSYALAYGQIARFTLNGLVGAKFGAAFLSEGTTFTGSFSTETSEVDVVTFGGGTFTCLNDATIAFAGEIALADDLVFDVADGAVVTIGADNVLSGAGRIVREGDGLIDFAGDEVVVSAKGWTGVVDGEAHSPSVGVQFTPYAAANTFVREATVEYSTDEGDSWTAEVPAIAAIGEHAIQYRVVVAGVIKASGNCDISISKMDDVEGALKLGTEENKLITCTGAFETDSWTVTTDTEEYEDYFTLDTLEGVGKTFQVIVTTKDELTVKPIWVTIACDSVTYRYKITVGAAGEEGKINLAYGGAGMADEVKVSENSYRNATDLETRYYKATLTGEGVTIDTQDPTSQAVRYKEWTLTATKSDGAAQVTFEKSANKDSGYSLMHTDDIVTMGKRVAYVGKKLTAYCWSIRANEWTFTSANETIATVSGDTASGTEAYLSITGVKPGKTYITASNVKVKESDQTQAGYAYKLWVEVREQPILDGTLTTTPITVGEKLCKSTITGTMVNLDGVRVDGYFAWDDDSIVPTLADSEKTQYVVTFTPAPGSGDYYDSVKLVATVKVERIPVAVPVPVEGLIYNGDEQTGVAEGKGYTLTGNTATDAGDYEAKATLEDGYVWEDGEEGDQTIEWSIAKTTIDMTGVTFEPMTVTYDGTPYDVEIEGDLPDGVSVSYDGNGQKDARDTPYTVTAMFSLTEEKAKNYNIPEAMTTTLKIDPAALTSASAAPQAYTGSPLTPVVTAKAGELDATFDVGAWDGDLVNVGTYAATVTGKGNFTGTAEVSFTITKSSEKPWADGDDPEGAGYAIPGDANDWTSLTNATAYSAFDYRGAYDGEAHTIKTNDLVAAYVAACVATPTITYSCDTNANDWAETAIELIDVGATSVWYKVSVPNYEDVIRVAKIVIDPAPVTVTADNAEKTEGEKDPDEFTAKVAGTVEGDEDKIAYTVTREEGETVGTYDIIPSGDEIQGNYRVTYVNGTFTIKAKPTITITIEAGEYVDDVQMNGISVVGKLELPAAATEVTLTLEADLDFLTVPVFKVTTNGVTTVTKKTETYVIKDGDTLAFSAEEAEYTDPDVTEKQVKDAIIDAIDPVDPDVPGDAERYQKAVDKVDAVVDTNETPAPDKVSAKDMATWISDKEIKSADMAESDYLVASVKLDTSAPITTENTTIEFESVEATTSDGFTFDLSMIVNTKPVGFEEGMEAVVASCVQTTGDLGTGFDGETVSASRVTINSDGTVTIEPDSTKSAEFFKIVIPRDPPK